MIPTAGRSPTEIYLATLFDFGDLHDRLATKFGEEPVFRVSGNSSTVVSTIYVRNSVETTELLSNELLNLEP